MTVYFDFPVRSEAGRDALDRCAVVVDDFVSGLGNLGALVAIDVAGIGRVTFTAGHSDITRRREVQPEDVYHVGSQTKTITAMLLYILSRDGLLDLDDAVLRHVDLPIDPGITVRHLLMNASGLGEYLVGAGPSFDRRERISPRDLVSLALPQGQIFAPGERFDYCNTGWIVAAMVVEAVTGNSYGAECTRRILKPLGLERSGFGGIVPKADPMRSYSTPPRETAPVDMTSHLGWAFGAGDGVASAGDMLAIYGSLLRDDSPLGISLADLAGRTMAPCANPYFPMSLGAVYGLGLERRKWAGREVWGHPGSTYSSRSSTWIDPVRDVRVATSVTTSLEPGSPPEDLRYPRAQLFAVALGTGYALADERTAI